LLVDLGATIDSQTFMEEEDEIEQTNFDDVVTDSDVSGSDKEEDDGTQIVEEKPNRPRKEKKKERSLSINLGNMSDNDKKLKGAITTNENNEVIRVTVEVYKKYNAYIGGWKQTMITNVVMIGFIVSKVYCDYFVGVWSNMPEAE